MNLFLKSLRLFNLPKRLILKTMKTSQLLTILESPLVMKKLKNQDSLNLKNTTMKTPHRPMILDNLFLATRNLRTAQSRKSKNTTMRTRLKTKAQAVPATIEKA